MASIINEDLTTPGTHALIIGISAYQHFADGQQPTPQAEAFGMDQLSAAARSASEFAAWLLNDYQRKNLPLKSLRVLLSPVGGEQIHPDVAGRLAADHQATVNNVKTQLAEFRNAINAHKENVAIVYIAGHGVQLTKHGAIVLLNDFGAPGHLNQLEGAIDVAGVHAGLNHPNTAQTQFWFVDACRQKPAIARRFESMDGALSLDEPLGVAETSPLFLAATTQQSAYAYTGGLTLFSKALLEALNGKVAKGPDGDCENWHISVTELIKRLPDRVMDLAEAEGVEQTVDIGGNIHDAVVHEFLDVPKVDLTLNLIPQEAYPGATATLALNATQIIVQDYCDWPFQQTVNAGLYLLDVDAVAPYQKKREILQLIPPQEIKEVNVQ